MTETRKRFIFFIIYGQWKTNLIETKILSLRVENVFQNATLIYSTNPPQTVFFFILFFYNFPKNESFPETFFNIIYLVNPFLLVTHQKI